jgi:integrase/recombinase XerD
MCQRYILAAKIGKKGSCHIFRHTLATLMLDGGADIRYVQEILGHESLKTTKIYTRVSIGKLKEVHEKTHPGAFLKRKNKRGDSF